MSTIQPQIFAADVYQERAGRLRLNVGQAENGPDHIWGGTAASERRGGPLRCRGSAHGPHFLRARPSTPRTMDGGRACAPHQITGEHDPHRPRAPHRKNAMAVSVLAVSASAWGVLM